jgi:rod shape-determining protein MreC
MQQIIFFFVRNKNLLLFLLLVTTSIVLTINTHSYHRNKFSTSANVVSGTIFEIRSGITDYFDLNIHNELLQEENRQLRSQLSAVADTLYTTDSLPGEQIFRYTSARVINNSIAKSKNYLTLNKGSRDGIAIDMGVISSNGIVGIVHDLSRGYASVQSVLNTNSQISAKLKATGHFGTLVWEGNDPYHNMLIDISSQVPVKVGDTVVTDGKSTIFPEGVIIGVIDDITHENNRDYYKLAVKLATDMTAVEHVYLVEHSQREEIRELEKLTEDAEQ